MRGSGNLSQVNKLNSFEVLHLRLKPPSRGEQSCCEGLTNDDLELLDHVDAGKDLANEGRGESCGKVGGSEESELLLGNCLGNPSWRVQCP